MTQGEIVTKLYYINRDNCDNIINSYISNGQKEALDNLPDGLVKARWNRRKAAEKEQEQQRDILGILATRDFLKKNNIAVN